MANYLYLFRGGQTGAGKSAAEQEAEMKKWAGWIEGLAKTGKFKGGEPLAAGGKVVSGKKKTVTDGPYAEAKDLVGGYLIVVAPSLDAATELSLGCPIFDSGGSLEVREIHEMKM
jgi:hypothetical protein